MEDEEYELGSLYTSEYDVESVEPLPKITPGKQTMYTRSEEDDSIKLVRPVGPAFMHLYENSRRPVTSVAVHVYETNTTPQHRIRDAVTGVYWSKAKVGTLAEDQFFKVCWATGHKGRQSPIVLFFHSPEEFERHMLCEVSNDVKLMWRSKQTNKRNNTVKEDIKVTLVK
jgi:hypothetical protein